jgi:hypothetical protein
MELKFFKSVPEVHAYVWRELIETLQDDLARMIKEERQHYDDNDRDEMRRKIADIAAVCPVELPEYANLLLLETDRSARVDGQGSTLYDERIRGQYIEWYAWGDGSDEVKALDSASRDHIDALLAEDYREGELQFCLPHKGDMIVRGYWRIKA